ncbi:helix-turn-helix domain-containing protein [Streptomyces wuyuanensis]|uniref:Helix-turn-helix domain-containing protein n=1 Tax=Streptomyces wuyuanensis TaxID=1196353 RepID=A0A1G9VWJ2_9ACTN|nr:helix-turn-helix domain-containing protein [Streptomyces wuyuanensis]SDM76560.1 hypothetical protein SAMN05444921_11321 [Streptomyces wuyuanensis]
MPDQTHTADPDAVLAMLRSDDTGPDAPYPSLIGVYCDGCGTTVERDIVVSDRMSKAERFEAARVHLRREGWSCTSSGDLCPTCKPKPGDPGYVHHGAYAPHLKGEARTTVARRAADLYEQGSTIKGVAQVIDRSYGNTRTLLLEAGVRLRPRFGVTRRTAR